MGWITSFFGMLLNYIFEFVVLVMPAPVATLGISIIVFTIITRLLMTPLQIMQQRTTKGMAIIQPELTKLQNKYKDKKDAESQAKQSAEMQALYKKHNINPLAGCLPLIIQMPLIIALFGVLRDASTYIVRLQEVYVGLADSIMKSVANYQQILQPYLDAHSMNGKLQFDLTQVTASNGVLGLKELLSKLTSLQWSELFGQIPADAAASMESLFELKKSYEWFGVNLVDTPSQLVKLGGTGMIIALMVPALVWISTVIYSKYTMAQTQGNQSKKEGNEQQQKTMNTMNTVLPLMTAFFSYTMPCGLALYWIAGNLIMLVQQIFVTKMIESKSATIN